MHKIILILACVAIISVIAIIDGAAAIFAGGLGLIAVIFAK